MKFSSPFTRSILRARAKIVAVAVLAPALLAVAGFSSSASASTAAKVSGGTFSSQTNCDYAGNIDVAVLGKYKSYSCTVVYDGPKGSEVAVWTLWLTLK
jgi:hypothetical protein